MNLNEQESNSNILGFDVGAFLRGKNPQDATYVDTSNYTPTITDNSFESMTNKVIDNLEGGYYHPKMKSGSAMGDSGETMMGIDRKHGGTINTTDAGKEFWKIIDDADASTKWKHYYKGGELEPKLKKLVAKMMKPYYDSYMDRYLSPEAKKIVEKNPDLNFHFVYATWNGPGWFQKFGKKINDAVAKGIEDPKKLIQIALRSRLDSGNSIIAQTGRKMDDILGTNLV